MTPQERFWNKVSKYGPIPPHRPELGPCWPWTASLNTWGYGAFTYLGRKHNASRIAYLFEYGQFDESKNVCHHCDNPACCRPSHLFLGTQPENLEDCRRKGRDRYARGEAHWNSKLTEKDVAKIENLLKQNMKSHRQIALAFGVSRSLVNGIARGEGWRHATSGIYEAMPKGTFTKGESAGTAKLTEADVHKIRAEFAKPYERYRIGTLIKRFHVTRENLYSIRDRKTWKHI